MTSPCHTSQAAEAQHSRRWRSRVLAEKEAKIENQRKRIVYLEGATNHATGTPLSIATKRAESAEKELAEAKAALEDSRKDGERLDWMIRESAVVVVDEPESWDDEPFYEVHTEMTIGPQGRATTPRAAIDAARTKE